MASLIRRVSKCWKGQCDLVEVGKGFPVRRGKVNAWGSGVRLSGRRQVPFYLFSSL